MEQNYKITFNFRSGTGCSAEACKSETEILLAFIKKYMGKKGYTQSIGNGPDGLHINLEHVERVFIEKI